MSPKKYFQRKAVLLPSSSEEPGKEWFRCRKHEDTTIKEITWDAAENFNEEVLCMIHYTCNHFAFHLQSEVQEEQEEAIREQRYRDELH